MFSDIQRQVIEITHLVREIEMVREDRDLMNYND